MARARNGQGDVGPELAAELLGRGREVKLRARGNSMFPLIRDGDLLTLRSLDRAPQPGEVVVAIRGCQLLIHRVLRADEQGVVLQGDALLVPDGWFSFDLVPQRETNPPTSHPRSRVVGRVALALRGPRQLGSWRFRGITARAWMQLLPVFTARRRISSMVRSWFTLLREDSRKLELPEKVDLIVHEIFETDPLNEGLVPVLDDARARLLKPGGRLCPTAMRSDVSVWRRAGCPARASARRCRRPS